MDIQLFQAKPLNTEQDQWGLFLNNMLLSKHVFSSKEEVMQFIEDHHLYVVFSIAAAAAEAMYLFHKEHKENTEKK